MGVLRFRLVDTKQTGVGPLQRIDSKILPREIGASQELRSPIVIPETVL